MLTPSLGEQTDTRVAPALPEVAQVEHGCIGIRAQDGGLLPPHSPGPRACAHPSTFQVSGEGMGWGGYSPHTRDPRRCEPRGGDEYATKVLGPSGSLSSSAGHSRPSGHPSIPWAGVAVPPEVARGREGRRAPWAASGPFSRVPSSQQCNQQLVPGPPAQLCPPRNVRPSAASRGRVQRGPATGTHARGASPARCQAGTCCQAGRLRIAPAFRSGPRDARWVPYSRACSPAVEGDEGPLPGKGPGCQPRMWP